MTSSGDDANAALVCPPSDKERLENRNADDQLEYITWLIGNDALELRESYLLKLHELCIADIYPCGGKYRTVLFKVWIENSAHEIPEAAVVPSLVREAVDWLNANRGKRSALECAAYALWRLNWIHPFAGGNGRTARAVAYYLVCAGNGSMLPGSRVMPDLIYPRREEYIAALQAVDASALASDEPDFSAMTLFLRDILTTQLASAIERLSNPGC